MSIREIPASYEHKCDSCGIVTTDSTKSRPSYWSTLIIEQDAYDYQGCAVADGTIRRSLCRDCTAEVVSAINNPAPTRDDVLDEAQRRLLVAAKMLFAHVRNELSATEGRNITEAEYPGWLADCWADIKSADALARSLKGGKS